MGLGLIIFGFFCLHFHYLDASVYSVELFPLSLGLLIILLGFLYAYHYTHQKAYLAFFTDELSDDCINLYPVC